MSVLKFFVSSIHGRDLHLSLPGELIFRPLNYLGGLSK